MLQGSGGVVLEASLTTKTTTNILSAGTGTLTIMSGKELSTSNMALSITVNDLDIQGQGRINVDNATLAITSTYEGHTFGLGNLVKDLTMTDAELGQLNCLGGLTVGSHDSGNIFIAGLTDSSTDTVGVLTLVATKAFRMVTFQSEPSSFNKGMTIQASSGVQYTTSVVSKSSDVIIYAGTGTLTVTNTKALSTSDRKLTLTADDLYLEGDLSTGTAPIQMNCVTPGRVVGFGIKKKFSVSPKELQRVSSTGFYLGGDACGEFWVDGIKKEHSDGILGVLTLAATKDDAYILFRRYASTFNALAAQADNGIIVTKADISTTGGFLHLDGDCENSSTGDNINTLGFTDGRQIMAKSIMTLEATTGFIEPAGAITLKAGTGVVLQDSMRSKATEKLVTINADFETAGDGTLTITSGKTVDSCNSDMIVTAWDLDLQGMIDVGIQALTIHGAREDQSIALGTAVQNLSIDNQELSQVTADGGVTIGSYRTGDILVSGITNSISATVGTLSLVATKAARVVNFDHADSMFNKGIVVQAMGGIVFNATMTTMASAVLMYAGTGTLTVNAGRTVSTTNKPLTITTDDIDWKELAALSAGSSTMMIHSTTDGQAIGLGSTPKAMHIEDDELGLVTAAAGLTIGDSHNSVITVAGITDSSSDEIGTLTLIALKPTQTISFANSPSSFNKGLTIQGAAGISLADSLTSKNQPVTMSTGTGTLTIMGGKALSTTAQYFLLTLMMWTYLGI